MKRFICLVLSILMIFTFFSCSGKVDEDKVESDIQEITTEFPSFEITFSHKTGESGLNLDNASPPYKDEYIYKSYKELSDALTGENEEESQKIISIGDKWGDIYKATVFSFLAKKNKVYVPTSNGSPMDLTEDKGWWKICFESTGSYGLPEIDYYCDVDGTRLRVSVAYLSCLNNEELNGAKSFVEVLKVIAPNAVTPSNYKDHSGYLYVYEEELTLGDGEKVTAMITTMKDNTRGYVAYYKDGAIFVLYAKMRVLTYKFLNSFDMVEYDAVK